MDSARLCTTPDFCFDLAEAAGLYSALMGVLTGFTFAVIIILFERRRESKETLDAVLVFVVAFVGASEAAFLYGTVAAEDPVPRILLKNLVAHAAGVTVFLLIIFGLVVLLRRTQSAKAIKMVAMTLVPYLVVTYATVVATFFDSFPASSSLRFNGWTWTAIGLYIFMTLALAAIALRSFTLQDSPETMLREWTTRVFAIGGACILGVNGGLAGVAQLVSPYWLPPQWVGVGALVIIDAMVLATALAISTVPVGSQGRRAGRTPYLR